MLPSPSQTQRTFLEQECYLPILLETFLTARKAEGRAKRTLDYYREKLTAFLSFCEAKAVTQIQDVAPDLLRRFLLKLAETHNPHDFRRAMAINYLRNGGDVFTPHLILGHKNLAVLRGYLALTERDTQEAHARYSPVYNL